MDHAASTPVRKEVLAAMKPFFSDKFGNPSSLHSFGKEARDAIERARIALAETIGAKPEEIIFTSGGTEADNLALKGIALAHKGKGKRDHIITTKIEHDAVLNTCRYLEKQGFKVTYLDVDGEGLVNLAQLKRLISEKTLLVSVMHANNEIGAIQPIKEIGKICRENGAFFHTDAVQTFCKEHINVNEMSIDLLAASSHKICGPKGVGFLYARKGLRLEPLMHGGGHEHGMRSGTENVSAIVGFTKAAELAHHEMKKENERLEGLRDKLIKGLLKIPNSRLNGSKEKRLANNVNVSFRSVEGESLILLLNEKGIAASTGSACSSKSLEPSHVLLALGLGPEDAHGSLRLTLGKSNTDKDIKRIIHMLPKMVGGLRRISPL